MSELTDLRIARLRKIEDSKDITAVENLEVMIADIKDRKLKNVRMIAMLISDKDGGGSELHPYNTGLDRAQEIGFINMYLRMRVEDYLA